jgi:pectin methylesterase-like acyl-CoA thioesterase
MQYHSKINGAPWRHLRGALIACCALALACACSSKSSDGGSAGAAPGGGAGSNTAGADAGGAGGASAGSPSMGGASSAGAPAGGASSAGAAGSAGAAPVLTPSSVTISSRYPANAASGVCADTALRLSFSAPVAVGATGKIQIFKTAAPTTPVDTIDVAVLSLHDTIEARPFYKVRPIFMEGNDAVMYLKNKALSEPGSYFVTIEAGAFVDANKLPLPAVIGATSWQFTTVAAAPSDATKLSVAREGGADFCSVQGAVDFVPAANLTPTTITIKKGTYHEIVYIPSKSNLTFHGEDRKQSIIAYPNNDTLQMKLGVGYRAMIEAEHSNGLVFENLTLHNTTAQGGSQAEALRVEPGDQVILRDADFISLQDTLLLSGRAYVTNSYVEGNVDYIWGTGTAYFDKSELKTVGRAGYLVQSRNGANYGYVFVDSTLSTDGTAPGATVLARIEGDRFPYSNVAYVNCKMGAQIAPKGWLITNSTGMPVASLNLSNLKFWEYQSTDLAGALLDVSMRDPASHQMTATEATTLRDKTSVLAGWNPTP